MDDPGSQVILLLILLLASAFFSGMEIAFISANRLKIELDKAQGKRGARLLSQFVRKPKLFIASMLVGNNIALTWYSIAAGALIVGCASALATSTGWRFFSWFDEGEYYWLSTLLQTLISTVVVLFAAEFIPKAIFRSSPNSWLSRLTYPLALIVLILRPLAVLVTYLSNGFIRSVLKADTTTEEATFGKTDLSHFLQEATAGVNDPEELEHEFQLVQNALDFGNVKARDCMVPRTEIAALEIEDAMDELRALFAETGYSKVVIYRETIDNIIGYVHSFELFKHPEQIKNILLPPAIVPEAMGAQEVLQTLLGGKRNLAVVVDEFGGTSGIITMEDIVEEIFGEIEDEHDQDALLEVQLEENEYLLSARQEIDYLNEKFKLELPESDDYETLGGYIVSLFEDIPEEGAAIEDGPYRLVVAKVSETRIEEVHLTVQP